MGYWLCRLQLYPLCLKANTSLLLFTPNWTEAVKSAAGIILLTVASFGVVIVYCIYVETRHLCIYIYSMLLKICIFIICWYRGIYPYHACFLFLEGQSYYCCITSFFVSCHSADLKLPFLWCNSSFSISYHFYLILFCPFTFHFRFLNLKKISSTECS